MSNDTFQEFDVGNDYFSVFSLSTSYDIDVSALKPAYLALQQKVHPDRFVNAGESQQSQAVKKTAYLNQAYETLVSPVKRAIYLLELRGVNMNLDSETTADIEFLQSQLEMREALSELGEGDDPWEELDTLTAKATGIYRRHQTEFAHKYTVESWSEAKQVTHKLMFLEKFLSEIKQKAEQLED